MLILSKMHFKDNLPNLEDLICPIKTNPDAQLSIGVIYNS